MTRQCLSPSNQWKLTPKITRRVLGSMQSLEKKNTRLVCYFLNISAEFNKNKILCSCRSTWKFPDDKPNIKNLGQWQSTWKGWFEEVIIRRNAYFQIQSYVMHICNSEALVWLTRAFWLPFIPHLLILCQIFMNY